ncbi:dipeptidase E [Tangfeifania diversioriginum]|uniref:dipeptidase E n=1 Tax=Tangfeifania diversioriginum TaxID=1168035 RepID=A0A1M6IDT2_9BACT|nr:dipeptidase PepE [Tangfeifania diversioriginum]SHJ32605.1 dipeptidase E [Tangfeifania diversioriginum]
MKLLLISNSTMAGEPYLDYPKYEIRKFLGEKPVTAVFIPYAAVTFSFDEYCEKVEERFAEVGHHIVGVHTFKDQPKAIEEAEAIVVGGGNTWQLVRMLHDKKLMNPIRENAFNGSPYIGWSAGANIACPTLRTTNDMPIIDPHGFDCAGLIPFQINPHYLDANAEGHAGETREQRIMEFTEINPDMYVAGLREGTILKLENEKLKLIGERSCRIFKKGKEPVELAPDDDFSFLMETGFLA